MGEDEESGTILILFANSATRLMPVHPLISFCETVKRMVGSRSRFGVTDYDGGGDETPKEITNSEAHQDTIMELSLIQFDTHAVSQFLDALVSLLGHQNESRSSTKNVQIEGDSYKKRRTDDEKEDQTMNDHVIHLIDNEKISEQYIVECLKIAHYLQCGIILGGLSSILEASIDSNNCMAICSLADLLNIQSLFEASVNHVVERLDAMQGQTNVDDEQKECSSNHDDGKEEIWKSLPHELRCRILTMRNVMRSSVIGRGSKVSGVFFSCGDEFLAIFRETIRDQRERLSEALERREEVIRERLEEWTIRKQRRGAWFDASVEAEQKFVHGGDVEYSLEMIKKQERRLQTLESFYNEQKIIFKVGGRGSTELIL